MANKESLNFVWRSELNMPVIKIYYDNVSVSKNIKAAWGFSALVKYKGRNILFDAGGNAEVLSANMKKMGSDPKCIEFVVISHKHWDHVDGVSAVLPALPAGRQPSQKVYFLKSFSERLKKRAKASGAKLVEIIKFQKIIPGIYTTGEMGKTIKEQSLIIDTPKGLIIVTGCSHPGIVDIVRHSKKKLKKDIYFVIGGFHLKTLRAEQVRRIINELKELGVKRIAPCHCTGEKAISIFQKEFQNDFIKIGVGSIIGTDEI
ncbi:MAG: MBL fold metallo-hydrolase [Candidatus Margulisiibacteriota bacterium]